MGVLAKGPAKIHFDDDSRGETIMTGGDRT